MKRPALARVAARTCYGCGKPSAPVQTEAARRRPYACPRCLAKLADRLYVPSWVEDAIEEQESQCLSAL